MSEQKTYSQSLSLRKRELKTEARKREQKMEKRKRKMEMMIR